MATSVPEESIQQIGREIVDDARRLVTLEIQLARVEAMATAKSVAVEIALLVVALLLVLVGVAYALLAIPDALGILDHFWGWLASAGALFLLAGLIALVAYLRLRTTIKRGKAAVEQIKGDVEWARQLPSRRNTSSS